jgi:hypothetical protein
MMEPERPQMHFACWISKVTRTRTHIQREICNIAFHRNSVTSHVHCLSCYFKVLQLRRTVMTSQLAVVSGTNIVGSSEACLRRGFEGLHRYLFIVTISYRYLSIVTISYRYLSIVTTSHIFRLRI